MSAAVRHTLTQPCHEQRRFVNRVKKRAVTYYINLAIALSDKGKTRPALAVIEAAVERFYKNKHVFFCKARILRQEGRPEAAYEAFRTGFDLNSYIPEYEDLVLGGDLARKLGHDEDALGFFKLAVERNPFRPKHHLVHIDALLGLGRKQEARAALHAALQRFPEDPDLLSRGPKAAEADPVAPAVAPSPAPEPETAPAAAAPVPLARLKARIRRLFGAR